MKTVGIVAATVLAITVNASTGSGREKKNNKKERKVKKSHKKAKKQRRGRVHTRNEDEDEVEKYLRKDEEPPNLSYTKDEQYSFLNKPGSKDRQDQMKLGDSDEYGDIDSEMEDSEMQVSSEDSLDDSGFFLIQEADLKRKHDLFMFNQKDPYCHLNSDVCLEACDESYLDDHFVPVIGNIKNLPMGCVGVQSKTLSKSQRKHLYRLVKSLPNDAENKRMLNRDLCVFNAAQTESQVMENTLAYGIQDSKFEKHAQIIPSFDADEGLQLARKFKPMCSEFHFLYKEKRSKK